MKNMENNLDGNISHGVNSVMSIITDAEVAAHIAKTLLSDTANELFDKYEESPVHKTYKDGREYLTVDINDVSLMWYTIQHYEPYISAVTDYINRIADRLKKSHQVL